MDNAAACIIKFSKARLLAAVMVTLEPKKLRKCLEAGIRPVHLAKVERGGGCFAEDEAV